jgi:hypothetical protein
MGAVTILRHAPAFGTRSRHCRSIAQCSTASIIHFIMYGVGPPGPSLGRDWEAAKKL